MPLIPTSNNCVYLGIDPGASGGIAVLFANGQVDATGLATLTDAAIWDVLGNLPCAPTFAVIEKVGGYVGENQPGSSAFKFGRSTGFLHGCLVAAGIPYEEVTPQRWQKSLGIPGRKKDETKGRWKARLKQHAERLYPKEKITLAVADAYLIATYAKRSREGTL